MDRQALITQRDRLQRELSETNRKLNEINREIERLDKEIRRGKIKKTCDLLEELWEETSETFEIENSDGDNIYIDFEDLFKSIKRYFGV